MSNGAPFSFRLRGARSFVGRPRKGCEQLERGGDDKGEGEEGRSKTKDGAQKRKEGGEK